MILQSSLQIEGQANSRLLKVAVGHTVMAQTTLDTLGISAVGLRSTANTMATSAANNKNESEVFITEKKIEKKKKGIERNSRKKKSY
jgi:hypothetical protein